MHACKVKVTGDPPCGMPGNAWRAKTIQVPCPAICLSVRWRPYGAPFFVQWASPGFPDTGGSPFSGPPRDPIGNSTLNASGTSLVRNRAAFCGIIAIVGFATGCVTSPPPPPVRHLHFGSKRVFRRSIGTIQPIPGPIERTFDSARV